MKKDDWRNILSSFALLTQIGLMMVASVGIGFFLGYFVDNVTGNQIIFKVFGLVLGVIAGFFSIYQLIKKFIGNNNHD